MSKVNKYISYCVRNVSETAACRISTNTYCIKCYFIFPLFNRDYVTYMLMLVVFYLLFPAMLMMSSYDGIYKHFKKIHHHRVNMCCDTPALRDSLTSAVAVVGCYIWPHRPRKCSSIMSVVSGNVSKMAVHILDSKAQDMSLIRFSWQPGDKLSLG